MLIRNLSKSVGINDRPDNVIAFLRNTFNKELPVMAGLEEYIKLYPINARFTYYPYKDPAVESSIILRAWERAAARVPEHTRVLERDLKSCFYPNYFSGVESKLLDLSCNPTIEIRHEKLELCYNILKTDLELMGLVKEVFNGEELNIKYIKMLADNFRIRPINKDCANLRLLNFDSRYEAPARAECKINVWDNEVKDLMGKYELSLGFSSKQRHK